MTIMKMSDAIGRSVVSADSASGIGEVKGFVTDPTGHRIDKVHVSGRKKKAELLAWSAVRFGNDAVMAEGSVQSVDPDDDREFESVKGNVGYLGARILDCDGFEHGKVTDVEFDSESGSIVRIHGAVAYEADRIKSLGSYAVIVTSEA